MTTEREYRASLRRAKDALEGFLYGWPVAANLCRSPNRDDVLAALSDHDRALFLEIEGATSWPDSTAAVHRRAVRTFLRSKGP
jgi:hypothetical protein